MVASLPVNREAVEPWIENYLTYMPEFNRLPEGACDGLARQLADAAARMDRCRLGTYEDEVLYQVTCQVVAGRPFEEAAARAAEDFALYAAE